MIFATSDIHGYPLDSFLRLLEKAGFSASDRLYVIGDVIDRNGDGEGKTAVPEDGGFCVQEQDGYSRYSMETSASSVVSAGTIR